MILGIGSKIIKSILFAFNAFCMTMGLASVIFAVVIFIKKGHLSNLSRDLDGYALGYALLSLGIVTLIISAFGALGTIKESHPMLFLYSLLLLIVAVTQIVVVSCFLAHRSARKVELVKYVADIFSHPENHLKEINDMQRTYNCCGDTNPGSWSNKTLPKSCCPDYIHDCTTDNSYHEGCRYVLLNIFKLISHYFTGASWGLVTFEVLTLMSAIFLAMDLRMVNSPYEELH